MKPMPLMDKVHAWTFAAKRGPMKLEPAVLDVQRTLRTKLRAAERFSFDPESARQIGWLYAGGKDRMAAWSHLARLPHDVTWIELSNLQDRHVGFLLFRDSTTSQCSRWIAHGFVEDERFGVHMRREVVVFDPEGDDKHPVRGSEFWGKPTISLRPGFPRMEAAGLECDIEALLTIHGPDERSLPEQPNWLMPRMAVIAAPWWDAQYAREPEHLNAAIFEELATKGASPLMLITTLAALNGLPSDKRLHTPRPGKHSAGMHQLSYFGYSTVSLAIEREDQLLHARKALDKAARAERHLRRHSVRGHWRVTDRSRPVTYLCRHLPTMVEDGLGLCERCEMMVRWIETHERGDIALGVVHHDYEVTASPSPD